MSERAKVTTILAIAQILGTGLWFSASAVAPTITASWSDPEAGAAWLTLAVQLGFVAGTLLSAFANLPDYFSPRLLLAVSAAGGAAANAAIVLGTDHPAYVLVLRFATGLFLAGIYPPAMKLIATWYREGRGLALGILVGALTLGKASPYLANALITGNWQLKLLGGSAAALVAGALVLLSVREGPLSLGRAPFDPSQVLEVFRNRAVRLATFGYFGHMWELYAMWTWAPVMIRASVGARGDSSIFAEAAAFVVIGSGAAGCVVAGRLADVFGRTAITSWAMAISGGCCVAIGFFFGGPPTALVAIAAVWGATVVADSAQFSACVTELADPRYVGTALTIQTSLGFLLTTLSIRLMPIAVDAISWRWAFVVLAPGPILGVVAMMRLRALPEASRLAGGRR